MDFTIKLISKKDKFYKIFIFSLGILLIDITINMFIEFPYAVAYLGNFQFETSNAWYWQLSNDGAWWDLFFFINNDLIRYIFVYIILPGVFYIVGLLLIETPKRKIIQLLPIYILLTILFNQILAFTLFEWMRITFLPPINFLIVEAIEYGYWYLSTYKSKKVKTPILFVLGVLILDSGFEHLFLFPRSVHYLGNLQWELSNAWFWEFAFDGNMFYLLNFIISNTFIIFIIIYLILPFILFLTGQLLLGNTIKVTLKNYLYYGLPLTLFVNILLVFYILPYIVAIIPPIFIWLMFLGLNIIVWNIAFKKAKTVRTYNLKF